jgi:hypothetical protein
MKKQENLLQRFNPAISKHYLLVIAGLMWTAVGVMLINYAYTWLTEPFTTVTLLFGIAGATISVLAFRFQFSKLALKNIVRILGLADKACLFSFQAWKGYLIIVVMVTGGLLLRGSVIPKPWLAIVYLSIGGALLLSSFQYYAQFYQTICLNDRTSAGHN